MTFVCPKCDIYHFIAKMKIVSISSEVYSCGKCFIFWIQHSNKSKEIFGSLLSLLKAYELEYGRAEIQEMRLICQMCDGNGEIYEIKIPKLKILLQVCGQCEVYWDENEIITQKAYRHLSDFLKAHNLKRSDITEKRKKLLCPRCDGNGEIYRARIPVAELEVQICDYCEAYWTLNEQIKSSFPKDILILLREHDLNFHDIEKI